MVSIGIDISKGKSTVCILRPYGEVRVVMEATGAYHLPLLAMPVALESLKKLLTIGNLSFYQSSGNLLISKNSLAQIVDFFPYTSKEGFLSRFEP